MIVAGALLAAGLAFAVFRWTERLPWLLCLTLALPTTAVVNVGGQSITPYFVVAVAAVLTGAFLWTRRGEVGPFDWPGSTALVVFVVWSLLVTAAGPSFFSGVEVLIGNAGIDEQVADPGRLDFTLSNLAQAGYVLLGAGVLCFLATRRLLSPHMVAPGLGLAMLLSNWRLAFDKLGLPYPVSQIDNSANYEYINSTTTGEYRLRGVFPEPSGLGLYAVAAVVLAVAMIPRTRGWVRVGYVVLAASAALNLLFANSGTSLVAGGALLTIAVVLALTRAVRHGIAVMPLAITLAAGTAVFLALSPRIVDYLTEQIEEKLTSTSYAARTAADLFSLELGVQTFGIGVGLGSNRPSSLWPMLFSCVGVIGTLAFLVLVYVLLRRSARLSGLRPFFWLLLAVVLSKSIAGSSLSDPLLQLALGLAAWAATTRAASPPPPASSASPGAAGHADLRGPARVPGASTVGTTASTATAGR